MSKQFKKLRKQCKEWYDLDLGHNLCTKHPQFKGLSAPTGGCEACVQLYRLISLIKGE